MARRSRFQAPRVLADFAAALRAFRQVQESLDDISRGRAELAVNLRSFNLVAGNFHRASAPAAGMQARLPKASGENLGDAITLHLEGMLGNLDIFAAPGDLVNGAASARFDADGVVVLWSNGVDAWSSVAQTPVGGAGTPTWSQVLASGNTSGASNPTIDASQHLDFAGGGLSAGDIRSAADLTLQAAAGQQVKAGPALIAGDPGTEESGITVGGTTFESVLKASDIGGTLAAQFIIHRHSTSLEPVMVFSRSNSDTSAHALVTDGQGLGTIYAAGHDGTDYAFGGFIAFLVDGAPGNNDMPTRLVFATTADGTGAPTERFRINSAGAWGIGGATFGTAGQYYRTAGSAAQPTWATIAIGELGAIAADSFVMNPTGSPAAPSAVAGSTVAGAGLTYTTGGILAVGAGTRITVNANDVQLAAGAAESFLGNFTAGSAVADYRAGSSVAGGGLTYTAGGTLAVGAGTGITVNANDVQLTTGAAETFFGNFTAGVAVGAYRAGSSVAGAGLTYTAGGTLAVGSSTSITVNADDIQRAALTGAISASANANTTVFSGIKNNAAATTDRTNLNFIDSTHINAVLIDDAGNDEIEVGYVLDTTDAYSWSGDHTFSAAVMGSGAFTTTLSGGTTNNLAIGSVSCVRCSFVGNQSLTGMVPTSDGQWVFIENVDDTDFLDLIHDSTSTAANRFYIPRVNSGYTAFRVFPRSGVWVRYDNTLQRWILAAHHVPSISVSKSPTTSTGVRSIEFIDGNGITVTHGVSTDTVGAAVTETIAVDESDSFTWTGTHLHAEKSSSPTVGAGNGLIWVQNLAPTQLVFTDDLEADWQLNNSVVDVLTATQTVTNSTSANDAASFAIPANTLRAGTLYKVEGICLVSRGATATAANVTFDILLGGTVYATCTVSTFTSAGTGHSIVTGYLRCVTIGATGTFIANMAAHGDNANIALAANPTRGEAWDLVNGSINLAASATTKDTTSNQTIILRATMSAAVANLSTNWTHAAITRMR